MGVEELVRRMLAGDRAAVHEAGKRLTAGDRDFAVELGRGLTSAAEAEVETVRQAAADSEDPVKFQADLVAVRDLNTSNPGSTAAHIEELEFRARRLGTCQTVQVLGLNARRLTLVDDLVGARVALEQAVAESGSCRACELNTLRREALLLMHLEDHEGALRMSQRAMDGYDALGGPGHDLDGDGWASSLIVRADARFHLGDKAGSAADFATALGRFPRSSKTWRVTHQNFASTLALTGPAGQRQVSRSLTSLRLSMRRGVTVERASFLWLDGQIVVVVGDDRRSRRDRGLDRLRTSLRLYGHPTIATPGPWLGVGSDYTRVLFPDRKAIEKFLEKEMVPHADRLIKADIHREQLDELCALASNYRSRASRLRRAIETLREAGGAAMPCLLPPWPARIL